MSSIAICTVHVSLGLARHRYAASWQVYKQSLWMALHDAPCAKRTVLYSSMATISSLDLGRLSKEERERRTSVTTVRAFDEHITIHEPAQSPTPHQNTCCSGRFIDKKGVPRFSGNKDALKKSGILASTQTLQALSPETYNSNP